jgi:hypothetical protein
MSDTIIRVIVLDGLDWPWVSEHLEELPALKAIADAGCSAPLRACDHPVTSDGVAALLAGREIDVPWVKDDRFATSQELIRTRPWFSELARYQMSVSLTNVPLTWPAFPMPHRSWVMSGFPIPAGAATSRTHRWYWPPHLDVQDYPIDTIMADHGPGGMRDLELLCKAETQIAKWFMSRPERCTVEILWFRSGDGAGHHCWGTKEYTATMKHLDWLVDDLSAETENLLVISDHGFDAIDSPRCEVYMSGKHGSSSKAAGLVGAHAMEGILFAKGKRIAPQGLLSEQKLIEVAGGIFDVLQLSPAPGMISKAPQWVWSIPDDDEDESMRKQLKALGYL